MLDTIEILSKYDSLIFIRFSNIDQHAYLLLCKYLPPKTVNCCTANFSLFKKILAKLQILYYVWCFKYFDKDRI